MEEIEMARNMTEELTKFYNEVVKNAELLMKEFPHLNITRAQIEEYCTQELLEAHNIAKEIQHSMDLKEEAVKRAKNKAIDNHFFNRVAFTYVNPENTEEVNKQNKEFFEKFDDKSRDGQNFVTGLYREFLQGTADLDENMFNLNNTSIRDCLRYFSQHENTIFQVMDSAWQNGLDINGFAIPQEHRELVNNLSLKGQGIGGVGRAAMERYSNMNLLSKVGFLTDEQIMSIMGKGIGETEQEKADFINLVADDVAKRQLLVLEQTAENRPVPNNAIVTNVPEKEELQNGLAGFLADLQSQEFNDFENEDLKEYVANYRNLAVFLAETDFENPATNFAERKETFSRLYNEAINKGNDLIRELRNDTDLLSAETLSIVNASRDFLIERAVLAPFTLADLYKDSRAEVENEYADDFDVNEEDINKFSPEEINNDFIQEIQQTAPYSAELKKNIEVIKSIVPDFAMSDKTGENFYVNMENIQLQKEVREYIAKREAVAKASKADGKSAPWNYQRIFNRMYKIEDTPEAREFNTKLGTLLSSPTKEGVEFRKELLADMLNEVNSLDPDKLNVDKTPFKDVMRYVVDNMDKFDKIMDYQYVVQNMTDGTNISWSPDLNKNVKDIVDKAVEMGSYGMLIMNLIASDDFMKIPFNDFNSEQLFELSENARIRSRQKDLQPEEKNNLLKFRAIATALQPYANGRDLYEGYQKDTPRPNHTFTKDDFVDIASTLIKPNELKENILKLRDELLETDPIYVLTNKQDFRNLKESLNHIAELVNQDDFMKKNPEELKKAMLDVHDKAMRYANHVGLVPKNDRQKSRLEVAKKIHSLFNNLSDEFKLDRYFDTFQNAEPVTPRVGNKEVATGYQKRLLKAEQLADAFGKMDGQKWSGMNEFMKQVVDSYKLLDDYAKNSGNTNMLKNETSKEYKALMTVLAFEQNIVAIDKAQSTGSIKENSAVDIINKGRVNEIIDANKNVLLPVIEAAKVDGNGIKDFLSYRPKDMAAIIKAATKSAQEEFPKAEAVENEEVVQKEDTIEEIITNEM